MGVSMSHTAYRRMLFRAEATSGPNLIFAYHQIIRGVGSRLCNAWCTTQSISLADTAYTEIPYRRRQTETGAPLSSTEIDVALVDFSRPEAPKRRFAAGLLTVIKTASMRPTIQRASEQ